MKATAEQVKVESAYTRLDCNPSYAADWPGVMRLCITAHRELILRECYFAQSNYSSIFNLTKTQQHSPINRCQNVPRF